MVTRSMAKMASNAANETAKVVAVYSTTKPSRTDKPSKVVNNQKKLDKGKYKEKVVKDNNKYKD